jgi:hypothetical protein
MGARGGYYRRAGSTARLTHFAKAVEKGFFNSLSFGAGGCQRMRSGSGPRYNMRCVRHIGDQAWSGYATIHPA